LIICYHRKSFQGGLTDPEFFFPRLNSKLLHHLMMLRGGNHLPPPRKSHNAKSVLLSIMLLKIPEKFPYKAFFLLHEPRNSLLRKRFRRRKKKGLQSIYADISGSMLKRHELYQKSLSAPYKFLPCDTSQEELKA
jgi:hypothetical protein